MPERLSNDKLDFEDFLARRETLFSDQLGHAPHDLTEATTWAAANARRGTMTGALAHAKATGGTVVVPRSAQPRNESDFTSLKLVPSQPKRAMATAQIQH